MAEEPVIVSLHVEGFGGSEDEQTEISRAEWDGLTPAQRSELLQDMADEFAANHVASGWHIADPDDLAAAS